MSRLGINPSSGTYLLVAGALGTALALTAGFDLDASTATAPASTAAQGERPNILWITSEDNGTELGAYGDTYATTPSLDALAAKGFRYRTAWSNGPVCGAARTTLITGVYPESTGGEHMRSMIRLPSTIRMYPALLRDAGYYTTNNVKTDYNYAETEKVWDESSNKAHWRNRPDGKPFFAIFNITQSHESQLRTRPHEWVHDIARAPVPSYMPDVREAHEDWAQYYDQLTVMDRIAGERLAELAADGLADDTIVMYYGDHGPGMPRSKRTPFNSGLQVPLIVYIPPKFRSLGPAEAAQPGSESTRLVSFVDLAPTLLSLAGVEPPAWMDGRAFLGRFSTPDPEFIFGFRGRMDERYDLVRTVRDQRYIYIRNYMPHRPHGQHVDYQFQTPTTAVWKRMFDEGRLDPVQQAFWQPRASEELYDLQADPDETKNLAADPAHRATLERMRQALDGHERATRDVGFMPEYELHRDETTITAYERGHDPAKYDFEKVYAAAQKASDRSVALDAILPSLADRDPIVRYWAATGVLIRGADAVRSAGERFAALLDDSEPGPRIVAAEALARFGSPAQRARALDALLKDADASTHQENVAMFALYSLSQVDDLPESVKAAIARLPSTPTVQPGHIKQRENYLPKLIAAARDGVR
jgi:arylsulfatase A-like enzyme